MVHCINYHQQWVNIFNNWFVCFFDWMKYYLIGWFSARVITQNVQLIELAYKSISLDDLQKLFGLNRKMVEQICNERGWQIDSEGIYVFPKRSGLFFSSHSSIDPYFSSDKPSSTSNSNIAKLVELVCFLERWWKPKKIVFDILIKKKRFYFLIKSDQDWVRANEMMKR